MSEYQPQLSRPEIRRQVELISSEILSLEKELTEERQRRDELEQLLEEYPAKAEPRAG